MNDNPLCENGVRQPVRRRAHARYSSLGDTVRTGKVFFPHPFITNIGVVRHIHAPSLTMIAELAGNKTIDTDAGVPQ
jgi:hypothetical protein